MRPLRVLLVHLVSNGDCLMATAIARQIKCDYPGCHLTWAISTSCKQVIDNNPDVDAVWEITYAVDESPCDWTVWNRVRRQAEKRRTEGEFDLLFFTQVFPENRSRFDGTTRSSTFRNYPNSITVSVSPVVRLREQEVATVAEYTERCQFGRYAQVILMECVPASQQSKLNLDKGVMIAKRLVEARPDVAVIISTHLHFQSPHPQIFDGSCLSFRENVELSKYCTFLIGCSSGITWLLTSDSAKRLPAVQFLNPGLGTTFASVVYDFEHWGLPTEDILESSSEDVAQMTAIVLAAMQDFGQARKRYHEVFKPQFWDFLLFLDHKSPGQWMRIFGTCALFRQRNQFGWIDYLNTRRLARVLYVQGSSFCRGMQSVIRKRICGLRRSSD
jgi:hypothetical protein